jgi:uncharacterized DUF497 family protein
MAIAWDEAKRKQTLEERGIDFADAVVVFAGRSTTLPDERRTQSRGSSRQDGYADASW